MNKPRIVLAGGSGFLGRELQRELVGKEYEVVILTRSADATVEGVRHLNWDGRTLGHWVAELDGAKAVVNLTGKSVNCRYTSENLREINESRVTSVRVVDEAILRCARPPAALVQAASLAIYGDAGDRWCDENAKPGKGIPVDTCQLWEGVFNAGRTPRTRRVLLRIGFVLGRDGGALATLSKLARCFLGGSVGNGRQYISWLHIADMTRIFRWAIENDEASGVFNAAGPNPVTNAGFMRELRRAVHRPWSPPTPAWAVHLGSWLMRTEPCLALTGRRCIPKRLLDMRFDFKFPDLRQALSEILE